MAHVEKMEVDDFPFAVQLANTMNWNMTLADFAFMIRLEPKGCFVLLHDEERLGIATSVSFGKTGWFGNLVVKEKFRKAGVGRLLMRHAIDYLQNQGAETIGLYSYPHLLNFYESFDFEPDIDLLVLKGKAKIPSAPKKTVKAATGQDLPGIIDFDCRCFGANRQKLLEPIILTKGNLCYISTEKNEIIGYVAAKVYEKIAEVGPLVCHTNREEDAVLLLRTILSRLSGLEVFMYLPKKETVLLSMLYEAGFEEDFRVVRMFFGTAVTQNCIYAAESLERG